MKRIFNMFVFIFLLLPMITSASNAESVDILLLGTDNLGYAQVSETQGISRADAIYILSFQPDTGAVKLLSIERDYLVTLPGDLGENKLGTATFFGGPEMCMEVVNQLFELNIDKYLHIDITNMINAVDLIDGIDLVIRPDEVESVNQFIAGINWSVVPSIKAGKNHLNGLQSWAFLAMRDMQANAIESNMDRNDRQMRFLSASLDKAFQMDISEAIGAAYDVLPLINTNLSTIDLFGTINAALTADLKSVEHFQTPSGSYQLKRINMHRALVADDMPAEIKLVHDFLGK